MSSAFGYLALALLLLVGGGGGGYIWAQHNLSADLSQANSDKDVCVSASAAKAYALKVVEAKFTDLQQRHKNLLKTATDAIVERDLDISNLKVAAAKRHAAVTEKVHEVDCAALDKLALCPAIADQLWPDPATAVSGNKTGGH